MDGLCRWTIVLLTAGVTSCAVRDDFPMRSTVTGQEIVCHSGWYRFEEGAPELRVAEQCMAACSRYGFQRLTGNCYSDNIPPRDPEEDMKAYIPAACLP